MYENLPFQESMKAPLHRAWYYYGELPAFRPKATEGPLLSEWFYAKGQRPHSHNWGRKPHWRKKRREQRRAKRLSLSCSQVASHLEDETSLFFAAENPNTAPYTFPEKS